MFWNLCKWLVLDHYGGRPILLQHQVQSSPCWTMEVVRFLQNVGNISIFIVRQGLRGKGADQNNSFKVFHTSISIIFIKNMEARWQKRKIRVERKVIRWSRIRFRKNVNSWKDKEKIDSANFSRHPINTEYICRIQNVLIISSEYLIFIWQFNQGFPITVECINSSFYCIQSLASAHITFHGIICYKGLKWHHILLANFNFIKMSTNMIVNSTSHPY